MPSTVTVSSKNQIVIPLEARERLHILALVKDQMLICVHPI